MFAGHVGVALAVGKAERRINLGVFILAAVFLDFLVWLFVLRGLESVVFPPDYSATRQPLFTFPYSHGLFAALVWSALAGLIAFGCCGWMKISRMRFSMLVTALVFSHWLLDFVTHGPEMPIGSPGSMEVGLGLWNKMPLALTVEAVITLGGLALFLTRSGLSRAKKIGLSAVVLLVLAFTVYGMAFAPPPPSIKFMAIGSLVQIAVLVGLMGWLGRTGKPARE
jgi:hypothetical protein